MRCKKSRSLGRFVHRFGGQPPRSRPQRVFSRFVDPREIASWFAVRVCRSTPRRVISARGILDIYDARSPWRECTASARASESPRGVAGYIRTRTCYIVPRYTTYAVTFVSLRPTTPAWQPTPVAVSLSLLSCSGSLPLCPFLPVSLSLSLFPNLMAENSASQSQ